MDQRCAESSGFVGTSSDPEHHLVDSAGLADNETHPAQPGGASSTDGPRQRCAISGAVAAAAVFQCIEAFGWRKTTADDLAGALELSRATLYRKAPEGKAALLEAALLHEGYRVLGQVRAAMASQADLTGALHAALVCAVAWVNETPAIRRMLDEDRALLLATFSFDRFDEVLAIAGATLAPSLSPFVTRPDVAVDIVEWGVRNLAEVAIGASHSEELSASGLCEAASLYLLPGVRDFEAQRLELETAAHEQADRGSVQRERVHADSAPPHRAGHRVADQRISAGAASAPRTISLTKSPAGAIVERQMP